ncbi:hypothetical protein [Sphingomonas cavernae]|uniref:Uncharacterized protein n=1 Tax=Sphingomonas cavernae TaxID=2320861 RepID=A0A418WNN8_9SPHN|nr:hypothetical protein [Sphingomonas cavernae]RJF91611.1 hypothetical protein D3876_14705 [Sphingomonas cavernae]
MALRAALPIRIHCPVSAEALATATAGNLMAIEGDPCVARLLELIRGDNPLGDFDLYRGVCEIGFGAESFVPTTAAMPTLGTPDTPSLSPTIVLLTWIDADLPGEHMDALINAIVARHPWEVPVIEVGPPVRLFTPGA